MKNDVVFIPQELRPHTGEWIDLTAAFRNIRDADLWLRCWNIQQPQPRMVTRVAAEVVRG